MYHNFDDMINAVKSKHHKKTCAVVVAESPHTLEAVMMACREGIVEPILIGNEPAIRACLEEIGENDEFIRIVPARSHEEAAQTAADLVNADQAEILMKGGLESSLFMGSVFNKKNGLMTGSIISAFTLLDVPLYHKLLAYTDGGITLYPDLTQKKHIIENAVEALGRIGIPCPKTAVLTPLEYVNPKIPETVDAHELQKMNERGDIRNCIVSGPISYDLAVSSEAAKLKGFESPVAGDADLLVLPDIVSGNMVSKALIFSGGAKAASCVIGAKPQIIFSSRSSPTEDKYRAIILASLLAGGQ